MPLYRQLLRGLLLISALLAFAALINSGRLAGLPDRQWIDTAIRGQGLAGEVWFVVVAAAFASIGLPRQVVAFLGGYAFGFLSGTALALLAVVFACQLSYVYGRLLGRFFCHMTWSGRLQTLARFIHSHTFKTTLLIRLLPAGSNLLVNFAAGAGAVRPVAFIAGSALGYIPQTLVFALIGSGVRVEPGWRIGLGVVLFVAAGLLGVSLYRKYRDLSVLEAESGV